MPTLADLYAAMIQSRRNFSQVASNSLNPEGYHDIHRSIREIKIAMGRQGILPPENSWFSFNGRRWNEKTSKSEHVSPTDYIMLMLPVLAGLTEHTREDLERMAEGFMSICTLDFSEMRAVDLDT